MGSPAAAPRGRGVAGGGGMRAVALETALEADPAVSEYKVVRDE